jgi:probable addiction module antidote protein
MMAIETRPFDPAEYVEGPEGVQAYLADALGVVARAAGMSTLAQRTGLTRQALYKALNRDGNPEFATILKVAAALGYRLTPEPISA